jgi:phage FluMu protein Com
VVAVSQTQIRCGECNRRLGDFVNEVREGQVILELECPKCGRLHMEIIRPLQRRSFGSRSSSKVTRAASADQARELALARSENSRGKSTSCGDRSSHAGNRPGR